MAGSDDGAEGNGGDAAERALVPVRVLPPPANGASAAASVATDDPVYLGLTAIGPAPSERAVREHALVLQSKQVWHVIKRTPVGWVLLVRDADYPAASEEIRRYESENRNWPPPIRRERPRHEVSSWTPLVFAALVAFFMVTGPAALDSRWFARGTAVTDLLLTREPWRAVTALTLHADSVHVLGNAISGTIFGALVNRRIGAGAGALAILGGGAIGNVGNALWHHASRDGGHMSIGASTAVFAAIGILAATQVAVDRPKDAAPRRWLDVAGPIVGGFALLGALGAGGANTDLGAHFFGLIAGGIFGGIAALVLRRKTADAAYAIGARVGAAREHVALGSGAPNPMLQALCGALAASIVLVAWILALRT